MKYFLGIDNGGTMVKAALFDSKGRELATSGIKCSPIVSKPGYAERDSEVLWLANCRVCKETIEKSGVNPNEIACVTVTGHGKGMYLSGKDGLPVYPGIVSTDTRAWEYRERWIADGTEKKAYKITKQHILSCQPVCLLAWMRDNEPKVMENTSNVFGCKDYIRYRFTGKAKAEISETSSSNVINLDTGCYDRELLELFGIEQYFDKLPKLCGPTEIVGHVTKKASLLSGIPEGTPVAGGTMDIIACALAVGVLSEEYLCMIAGTWSINQYISRKTILDGSIMLNSYFCQPGKYVIEESSPTSAVNNEWFAQNLLPELRNDAIAQGRSVYEIMNNMASGLEPAEFCPVFLPFIAASNVHPNACGSFVGISSYHTRAHLIKSIYEGVVFSHRYHMEKLLNVRDSRPKAIRLAGGPARSDVWVQMFADITQLPIERVTAQETGTLGCAMLGAVATKQYDSLQTAADNMCELIEPVLPNPNLKDIYDKKYAMYLKTIECLDSLWGDIQRYKDSLL